MTCVVGLVEDSVVWMGADSNAGREDTEIRTDRKIFQRDEFLIGFTSSFRMGQLLKYRLECPERLKGQDPFEFMATTFVDACRKAFSDGGYLKKNDEEEVGGQFLVGYQERLYQVHSDFQVGEFAASFHSIGSGSRYALGALSALHVEPHPPAEKIHRALSAAADFSAYVRPPFHVQILDERK